MLTCRQIRKFGRTNRSHHVHRLNQLFHGHLYRWCFVCGVFGEKFELLILRTHNTPTSLPQPKRHAVRTSPSAAKRHCETWTPLSCSLCVYCARSECNYQTKFNYHTRAAFYRDGGIVRGYELSAFSCCRMGGPVIRQLSAHMYMGSS